MGDFTTDAHEGFYAPGTWVKIESPNEYDPYRYASKRYTGRIGRVVSFNREPRDSSSVTVDLEGTANDEPRVVVFNPRWVWAIDVVKGLGSL